MYRPHRRLTFVDGRWISTTNSPEWDSGVSPIKLSACGISDGVSTLIPRAGVILFDPIFQGLAISLMAGEVASLLLSRMAVPVLYYMAKRHERPEEEVVATPIEAAS